jgi:hypothetical protein
VPASSVILGRVYIPAPVTLVFDLFGVICGAALIRALAARNAVSSLRGGLTCVAVVLGVVAFWAGVWPQARTLVRLHEHDQHLTSAQARALPGTRYGADEAFLAWASHRLPPGAQVFLDCAQPHPCSNALANWITYRLTPRVFTDYSTQAQWVLFYGTAAPRAAAVVRFAPGFALERLPG